MIRIPSTFYTPIHPFPIIQSKPSTTTLYPHKPCSLFYPPKKRKKMYLAKTQTNHHTHMRRKLITQQPKIEESNPIINLLNLSQPQTYPQPPHQNHHHTEKPRPCSANPTIAPLRINALTNKTNNSQNLEAFVILA